MSYHGTSSTSSNNTNQTTVDPQVVISNQPVAPPGFHYMPDGTLMSDADHARLNAGTQDKVITAFNLDLSDLPAAGESRTFSILGDNGAEFRLEVKDNTTGYYYNFYTNVFQVAPAFLNETIGNKSYKGNIRFPNTITKDTVNGAVSSGVKVVMDTVVASTMAVGDRVTGNDALDAANVTVAALNPDDDNANEFSLSSAVALADGITLSFSGDDQYDMSLHALPGNKHSAYSEVRFGDGSLDINSSTGSNSLMINKVIYQYTALVLTLKGYSVGGTVGGTFGTDIISINRGKPAKTSFSFTTTAAATAAYRVLKQPVAYDVLAFVEPEVGGAPINLPGENIYPSVSDTDTVDGVIAGGGSVIKVVMDNNVATNLVLGDKITAPVATDTIDGAVSSGIKVVMDNNVAGKMAIGDQVTGNAALDAAIITVAALNPDGDNAKEFSLSSAIAIADGITLTFSPKCNRSLTTVAVLNPDTDNVKEFSMSQNVGLIDGVTLSFSNQMNHSWPIDNFANSLTQGMIVVADNNVTTGTTVSPYQDAVITQEGTINQKLIIKNQVPAVSTLGKQPTVVKGLVTVQAGQIVFNKQQVLALKDDSLKIGGYGESEIFKAYGWDVRLTNLEVALTAPTTTTTEATNTHATIAVASKEGVINNVSTVSGIGIDSRVNNPLITSGGGATGAGDFVMGTTQSLENGATLTIENTGRIATITGDIEILKAGSGSQTLRFDVDRLLSTSA